MAMKGPEKGRLPQEETPDAHLQGQHTAHKRRKNGSIQGGDAWGVKMNGAADTNVDGSLSYASCVGTGQ